MLKNDSLIFSLLSSLFSHTRRLIHLFLVFSSLPVFCMASDGILPLNPEFSAVHPKSHPFLLATNDLLDQAKEKTKKYEWAQKNLKELDLFAKNYIVPARKTIVSGRLNRSWKSLGYKTDDSENIFKVALAWKLTGNIVYRDKVIHFIKDVCDPAAGYLSTGHATTGVQVHEGHFFLFLAAVCDILYDESLLSGSDHQNIESTFRYYLQLAKADMNPLGIMNHEASANAGAIIVSLFLQDMEAVNHFVESDGGMTDQLSKGMMADGWWFEGSPGYCYLVTSRYSLVAQAFENYGWSLYDKRFPTRYKSKDFDNAKEGFAGMKFDIWGPPGKNTRGLYDMYLGYIPMMDENGCLVANNDGMLTSPDEFYELAFRHFKKDELAWVLSKTPRISWQALLYGVGELPMVVDPRTKSAFVPNVGIVALRSQTENQKPGDQIQAYFKFGTHGGWHGHFDRTGMIALDRYGHKFFGTEMCWFGYQSAGYKECVQTSATHNMVIVDEMQQEAVPSEQLLFYDGKIMQASVVQTIARWRKIPVFNKALDPPWDSSDFEKGLEPVLQRRLSIVLDDYVVIADFMKSSQMHNYDWLIHPIGFKSIEGARVSGPKLNQISTQKDSPYKYFTEGQWYDMDNGAKIHFEDNSLNLDIHTLWPRQANVLIANYPSNGGIHTEGIRNNPARRTYCVRTKAKENLFLTVLEPFKNRAAITKIISARPDELTVFLADGREQKITVHNFQGGGKDIRVSISESKDNKEIRNEKTITKY